MIKFSNTGNAGPSHSNISFEGYDSLPGSVLVTYTLNRNPFSFTDTLNRNPFFFTEPATGTIVLNREQIAALIDALTDFAEKHVTPPLIEGDSL